MKAQALGNRHLAAARFFGAAVLANLGLLAAHTPTGYLGAHGELTRVSAQFIGLQLSLALLGVVALLLGHPAGRLLGVAVLTINMGFFVLSIFADPVAAGALVLWQAVVLVRLVERPAALRTAVGTDWVQVYGPALRHVLTVSLVAWTVALGFRVLTHPLAAGLCGLLAAVAIVGSLPFLNLLWRSGLRWKLALPVVSLILIVASIGSLGRASIAAAAFESLVLVTLLSRLPIHAELASRFLRQPPALVVGTFVLLIVAGTVLLSFPAASVGEQPLAPVDAVFTAASAACVTGLTVVDTGTDLSFLGQLVVLMLIQAGGLGILVLSGFAASFLGEGLGLRGRRALGESLDLAAGDASRLVRFIVVSTLTLEAIGASVLAFAFAAAGSPPIEAAWRGVFHAVSAFCNAGFALWPDSVVGFRSHPPVLLTVAALIVAGGLGFPVLIAAWARIRRRRSALRTHARIVVSVTAALIAIGAVGYAAGEWNRSLHGLSIGDKLLGALFQSVTLRTAGFNMADLSMIAPFTFLWMLVLMFIGASPGGTGGGIKTTTAAVLAMAVPVVVKGSHRAVVFGRAVPLEAVFRAAAILVVALGAALGVLTALLLTQPIPFEPLLFETISALGTVGLSLGVTPELDVFGKLTITAAMLIGRVGPLTLVLLLGRRGPGRLRYPEARIMVG